MLPESPVSVKGYIPIVTVGWVVIVRAVLAVGVIGLLPKIAFVPVGRPETLKATGKVNPFVAVNCAV